MWSIEICKGGRYGLTEPLVLQHSAHHLCASPTLARLLLPLLLRPGYLSRKAAWSFPAET